MNGRTTLVGAVVLAACAGNAPVDPGSDGAATLTTQGGVEYRAETLVMESYPVQLNTRVHVKNVGGEPKHLWFPDGCVVLVRAYREGTSEPVWDQGRTVGCTMALVDVHLAPGETRTFESRSDARLILGDSLPDGRYIFRAYLRPMNSEVLVDAGSADLSVPR